MTNNLTTFYIGDQEYIDDLEEIPHETIINNNLSTFYIGNQEYIDDLEEIPYETDINNNLATFYIGNQEESDISEYPIIKGIELFQFKREHDWRPFNASLSEIIALLENDNKNKSRYFLHIT